MFTEHNNNMQNTIADLQNWLASPTQIDGAKVIQGIHKHIAQLRMDKQTWDGLYSQHAKPKGKAKGKSKGKAE